MLPPAAGGLRHEQTPPIACFAAVLATTQNCMLCMLPTLHDRCRSCRTIWCYAGIPRHVILFLPSLAYVGLCRLSLYFALRQRGHSVQIWPCSFRCRDTLRITPGVLRVALMCSVFCGRGGFSPPHTSQDSAQAVAQEASRARSPWQVLRKHLHATPLRRS